jgi:hypothetical protein
LSVLRSQFTSDEPRRPAQSALDEIDPARLTKGSPARHITSAQGAVDEIEPARTLVNS